MTRRRVIKVGLGIGLLIAIVLLLQNAGGDDGLGLISADASSSYLGVGLLVFLDCGTRAWRTPTEQHRVPTLRHRTAQPAERDGVVDVIQIG